MNFHNLGIESSILRSLKEIGYEEPTPIQREAIPAVLSGRDLLGCAQTGTGKTAAFSLPMLQRMGKPEQGTERPVRGLILTPTRELALQIYENICQYSRYTGRIAAVIYGGVSQIPQVEALSRGADILVATPGRLWDLMGQVATPGRLWDLMGQKLLDISKVECFVLDEADRMLDMGFIADVKRIVSHLPRRRQTLLFSATMPEEIAELANSLLYKPVRVSITPAATPVELIEQGVYFAEKVEKRELLKAVLRQKNVPQTLVFSRTKHGADRIARDLNRAGISARALHGDKSQGARQTALKEFKEYKIAVLVATDIAARGLDISELPLVINFDLPNIPETYVHRIGRTGRAGMEGTALSFCAEDEKPYLQEIEKLTRVHIPELECPEDVSLEAPKAVEAERSARTGRRKAAAPEKRKQKNKNETSERPVQENKPKKKKNEPKPRRATSTETLAVKYPKSAPRGSGQDSRRRRNSHENLSMDISTPRTRELSEEAAARVRAKVEAKLAERAAARQKQAETPEPENPVRRRTARVRRRPHRKNEN